MKNIVKQMVCATILIYFHLSSRFCYQALSIPQVFSHLAASVVLLCPHARSLTPASLNPHCCSTALHIVNHSAYQHLLSFPRFIVKQVLKNAAKTYFRTSLMLGVLQSHKLWSESPSHKNTYKGQIKH